MEWPLDRETLRAFGEGIPRYEQIAGAIEKAVVVGKLKEGERLPTIRHLAQQLGVSGTTIAASYNLLSQKGHISSEVGRGTFVSGHKSRESLSYRDPRPLPTSQAFHRNLHAPWRRRSLMASASRLRAAHSDAADCSTGRPDPALLPLAILQQAWSQAIQQISPADLQYAGPEPIEMLVEQLLPRLNADSVPAKPGDIVVASSAQQFMVLTLQALAVAAGNKMVVAVEEPGYPTIFDAYERAGYRLTGVEIDEKGAIPSSLEAALAAGATSVLLTPRAHNPTGASWSVDRRLALADVLAHHPGVVAIEDDHFAGIAAAKAGSLLLDARIEDRVVYIRSFSKSLGPDLRIAVAVARPRLRSLLYDAKSFTDGWTSRLTQRAVANALGNKELDKALATACNEYAERRASAVRGLEDLILAGGKSWCGADGVNVWVHLPAGFDSVQVIGQAASLGVLVASGEPFFIRPGHSEFVRLNAGAVSAIQALEAGKALANTVLSSVKTMPVELTV